MEEKHRQEDPAVKQRELARSVFSASPFDVPEEFKTWLRRFLELNPPRMPLTSMLGAQELSPYTPVWTAATSNPSLGDGILTGRSIRTGHLVVFWIGLTMGSSTTYGTGAWRFSLPFTPSDFVYIGGAWAIDATGPTNYGLIARVPVPGNTFIQLQTTANPAVDVDATNPFTWANGDILRVSGYYEIP